MKCSNCGNMVPDGEKFCGNCGSKVDSSNSDDNAKYCPNCGSMIEKGNQFCPKCGFDTNKENNANESSSDSFNTKFCVNCGSKIDINAEICPKCGVRQNFETRNKTTKHCINCGSVIDVKAEICPKCGVRQMSQTSVSSDKSKFITMLLSVFLPGLGHFYLGLSRKGIILLILGLILSPSWLYGAGILYLVVWGYALYDSYKQSDALMRGEYLEDW